jgi:CubicO group peptidase (beta-lactamase class C family)
MNKNGVTIKQFTKTLNLEIMKKYSFFLVAAVWICLSGTAQPADKKKSDGIMDSLEIKIDTMIAQMGLSSETPGGVVAIIKDGKIIFQKAYGLSNIETKEPNKTSTLFNLESVSKQFTAAGILMLAEEHKLSLKDDIRKYLPDFPDYGYTITIENLVHHTCGIRSYDVLKLMAGTLYDKENLDGVYSLICKQKALNFKPGDEFLYSNSGYVLLAKIIEKTSGMTFADFIEEKIFKPAGMNQTFIYDNSGKSRINCAEGHAWAGDKKFKKTAEPTSTVPGESNVYTNVGDFLEWDNNFYKNRLGKWDFNKEMTSRTTLSNGDTCSYAFGLEISDYKGMKTISHQGGDVDFTAQYTQIPSEKFTVVCLFNVQVNVTGLANKITDLVLKESTQKVTSEAKPGKVMLDSLVLQQYTGRYFDENWWFEATVSREGDHLVFEAPYQGRFEIYPSSDTMFFSTIADLKFAFSKNLKGEINQATIIQGQTKFRLTYLGKGNEPLNKELINQYAGNYYCKDLDVTYPILVKDNKLYVKFPECVAEFCKIDIETELIHEHADYFASPVSGMQFARNGKNEVSGLIIKNVGRVRDLVFSKTAGN